MNHDDLRKRTKDFAIRIIHLAGGLPSGRCGDVLGRQLLRSGTSIGANYREALRASSKRHFTTTIEIAAREADYWLDLLAESSIVSRPRLAKLVQECEELLAILAATARSAKRRAD